MSACVYCDASVIKLYTIHVTCYMCRYVMNGWTFVCACLCAHHHVHNNRDTNHPRLLSVVVALMGGNFHDPRLYSSV